MKRTAILVLAGLGLSSPATAQAVPTPSVTSPQGASKAEAEFMGVQLVKSSTLESMAVHTRQVTKGELELVKIADFADVIVDGRSGEARYALLSRGGIGSLGDTLIAVPVGKVQMEWRADDEGERKVEILTTLTMERLTKAPKFDEDAWKLGDNAWCSEVDAYFGLEPMARPAEAGSKAAAGTQPAAAPRSTLIRLNEWIGRDVEDSAGERLAKVKHVVLDPAAMHVSYVVLGSGGVLGIGDELRAVSSEVLRHSRNAAGELVCSTAMTKAQLEAAPAFEADQWKLQGTVAFAQRVRTATQGQ